MLGEGTRIHNMCGGSILIHDVHCIISSTYSPLPWASILFCISSCIKYKELMDKDGLGNIVQKVKIVLMLVNIVQKLVWSILCKSAKYCSPEQTDKFYTNIKHRKFCIGCWHVNSVQLFIFGTLLFKLKLGTDFPKVKCACWLVVMSRCASLSASSSTGPLLKGFQADQSPLCLF